METTLYELRCPHCSQRNRVRNNVAPVNVRCGRCNGSLTMAMMEHELSGVADKLAEKGVDVKSAIREVLRGKSCR